MPKQILIPIALILMLILAACGGQTAEVSQVEAEAAQPETAEMTEAGDMDAEGHDDDMDEMAEESHEDDMDEMAEESHDDDMDEMAEESHDDDMDEMAEESHENDMDEEGHDDDMDEMAEESHDESMEGEGHDDDMGDMDGEQTAESSEDGMAAGLAAWQTIALTNAVTGEPFTFSDFQGKTVFVEPMATWCGNCARQQGEVLKAKEQLGDDVVFFGLSLETTLPADQLAAYAQSNGFDWNYAVMSPELLQELDNEFGRSITSAPSTPHFIIRPDGTFTGLATGIHSADEIVSEIQSEQG